MPSSNRQPWCEEKQRLRKDWDRAILGSMPWLSTNFSALICGECPKLIQSYSKGNHAQVKALTGPIVPLFCHCVWLLGCHSDSENEYGCHTRLCCLNKHSWTARQSAPLVDGFRVKRRGAGQGEGGGEGGPWHTELLQASQPQFMAIQPVLLVPYRPYLPH